jgi:hypothetical protein
MGLPSTVRRFFGGDAVEQIPQDEDSTSREATIPEATKANVPYDDVDEAEVDRRSRARVERNSGGAPNGMEEPVVAEEVTPQTNEYKLVTTAADGERHSNLIVDYDVQQAGEQSWKVLQDYDRSGVEIVAAQLEWNSKEDGPQVEYLFGNKQGFELYRPHGIMLSNEQSVPQPERDAHFATLLSEARLVESELRDPVTASDAVEAQAFTLQKTLNSHAQNGNGTGEAAMLRGEADRVEDAELTAAKDTQEEERELLAGRVETWAELVAQDHKGAAEKFASGVRNGETQIDLSQEYEAPNGMSQELARGMASSRHQSVGVALQPLIEQAKGLGIEVRLGSASIAKTLQIEQSVSAKRGFGV